MLVPPQPLSLFLELLEDLDCVQIETNKFFCKAKMVVSNLLVLCSNLFYFKPPNLRSLRSFFFIPTTLALITSLFILFYISSTSNLFIYPQQTYLQLSYSRTGASISKGSTLSPEPTSSSPHIYSNSSILGSFTNSNHHAHNFTNSSILDFPNVVLHKVSHFAKDGTFPSTESQGAVTFPRVSAGNYENSKVFHDRDIFVQNYKEMNKSLRIYVYPHRSDHPFANALLPVDFEPEGNYASESYFKKVLMNSHFITKDPVKADLFFLPFSIARLRHDPRVGINGLQDFILNYIFNISHEYPYWNRSGGADHFYVACHSIGRSAMAKTIEVKLNAIQVVCSSSYFSSAYVAHKDVSLPQIWPRKDPTPDLRSNKRKRLAFFAGSRNSPVREKLLQAWRNDSEISVHTGPLTRPYTEELLSSKFCLHVKGFEVNTARAGDALYHGCVPVIIANHYDLPFTDILDWRSFSVIVATLDIPLLKKILQGLSNNDYLVLKSNVLKVRKHFQWHFPLVDYDAFYMVMYELWLRRSSLRALEDIQ